MGSLCFINFGFRLRNTTLHCLGDRPIKNYGAVLVLLAVCAMPANADLMSVNAHGVFDNLTVVLNPDGSLASIGGPEVERFDTQFLFDTVSNQVGGMTFNA